MKRRGGDDKSQGLSWRKTKPRNVPCPPPKKKKTSGAQQESVNHSSSEQTVSCDANTAVLIYFTEDEHL